MTNDLSSALPDVSDVELVDLQGEPDNSFGRATAEVHQKNNKVDPQLLIPAKLHTKAKKRIRPI